MKVHLAMGNTRSLCGISPSGSHDVRSLATFFHSPDEDQCSRCLHHFVARGYSINSARAAAKYMPRAAAAIIADRVIA